MRKIYFKPEIECHNIRPCVLETVSGGQATIGGGGVVPGAKISIFDGTDSNLLDVGTGDMGSDLLDVADENDQLNL